MFLKKIEKIVFFFEKKFSFEAKKFFYVRA